MSFSSPTPRQAVLELIFAGALWGFGFVATQWCLTTWTPVGVLFFRFIGALSIGEVLHLFFRQRKRPASWKNDFFLAMPAGLCLGFFLLFQTTGLQYTSASKSGFITTLYVIFIPVINFLIFKKKCSLQVIFVALLACAGTFMLMGLNPQALQENINAGDVWTLASAVLGACQIIYIGRITQKIENPFRLNNFQSLWAMIAILPFALLNSRLQHDNLNSKSLLGIFVVAAACSVLAFYIQVRAQKVLSDTTASMLFLLESPYAFFFAYLFMGDRLNFSQSLGAFLILGAALWTVRLEQQPSTKTAQS